MLENSTHLNSSTRDDAHEEVRHNASHSHHQTLDDGHLSKQREDKVTIVVETWVQLHHEIDYGGWDQWNDEKERKRWEWVPHHESHYSIVSIQPLSIEYLHILLSNTTSPNLLDKNAPSRSAGTS